MQKNYKKTESGITIRIPLTLYARPAVIKALYPYHDEHLITYELIKDELFLYFEPIKNNITDIQVFVADIMKALDYQMIRYDTMKATNEIRQLLVGRALYATCIEPDHADGTPNESDTTSWKEDTEAIFKTWSNENP